MAKLSKSERREIRKQNIEKCQAHVDNTYGKNLIKVDDVLNGNVYLNAYKKKFELPEGFEYKAYLSENEKGVVLNIYSGVCEENVKLCKSEGFEMDGVPMNDCIDQMFDCGYVMETLEDWYEIEGSLIEWEDDIYSIQLLGGRYGFPIDRFESEVKAFFKPSDYDASSGLVER